MKVKRIVILFLLINLLYAYSLDYNRNVLDQVSTFLIGYGEGVRSISCGISADKLFNYEDGTIVDLIQKEEYSGIFGNAVVIEIITEYYYNYSIIYDKYYLMYSNIEFAPSLSIGKKIKRGDLIGRMSKSDLPFDSGSDVKIVVFSINSKNYSLLGKTRNSFAELPGISDFYLYPGSFILESNSVDYLSYCPVMKISELKEIMHDVEYDGTYHYDLLHSFRIYDNIISKFSIIDSSMEISKYLKLISESTRNHLFLQLKNYSDCLVEGNIYLRIVVSDNILKYYNEEVLPGQKVEYYLRGIGSYNEEDGKIYLVYGLMDFLGNRIEELLN